MNNPKSRTVALVAIIGFALCASSCTYEERTTAAPPALIAAASSTVEAEEPVDASAVTTIEPEVEVAGSTEEAPVTETALVEQSFEIVGVPRGLNMRTGPGASFDIIQGIEKDRIVTGTGNAENGWTEISFDGRVGWVASTYLQPTDAADAPSPQATELVVFGVNAGLNLRSGPGVDYPIVGGAPLGSTVMPTGAPGGEWIEVEYDGVVGWAKATYLAKG